MSEQKEFVSPLRFACVCLSNVNRSMAGHKVLAKNNYNVCSYATNSQISILGPTKNNLYDFGTTYKEIIANLKEQGTAAVEFYESQEIIKMVERDCKLKEKPERFASTFELNTQKFFDIIFTYQKRYVMEKVIAEFHANGNVNFELCHVINIETKDKYETALASSHCTLLLAQRFTEVVNQGKDITEEVERILNPLIESEGLPLSYHCVAY
ncbi:RNA polymerase II subunit A C-terminal domain phosphatase [Tritrichomonas musculus]|uniref:RNA polymerase II subunit A C-terminal domain phosphatase SSU72 n=1 Tax=Tritrichomonas musculus TaxID=1915356 RepID=A0ABR2K806_9EUKA